MARLYGTDLGNVAQALRMTGGDPALAAERDEEPMVQEPPPDVDRAMATLGYRDPRDTGVQDRAFDPSIGQRGLQREYTEGQNQGLALAERKGEIESGMFDRQAGAAKEMYDQRRAGMESARAEVDQNRAQTAEFEQRAKAQLDRLMTSYSAPPEQRGKALQVVGAILGGAGGLAGGLGRGLAMLGESMNGDIRQWMAQAQQERGVFADLLSAAANERADSEHVVAVEKAFSDMAFGVYGSALEQIKAEAQSEEAVRAADELQLKLRQGYVEKQQNLNQRIQAARAEQRNKAFRDQLYNMDFGELGQRIADNWGGELAQKVYEDRAKRAQGITGGELGLEKTAADIAKTRAEAARDAAGQPGEGTPVTGGYEIADPRIWTNLPEGVKADFSKGASAVPGLLKNLRELRDLVRVHGTETLPGEAKTQMQAKAAAALGGIKEAASLGALDNGVAALVEKQIGDPTAWNFGLGNLVENADKRIDTTIDTIIDNTRLKAQAYGLQPARPAGSGQPSAGQSDRGNMVRIRTPDGRIMRIPPANLQEAVRRGATIVGNDAGPDQSQERRESFQRSEREFAGMKMTPAMQQNLERMRRQYGR